MKNLTILKPLITLFTIFALFAAIVIGLTS